MGDNYYRSGGGLNNNNNMKINNYKTCSQELWAILVDRRLVSLDEVMERLTLQNKELNNLLAIS